MEKHWIIQDGNPDLVIVASGWGTDYHILDGFRPEGCDLLCLYDYRKLETIKPDEFKSYGRVYLYAWSFGVWAAEQLFRGVSLYKSIALNGTPLPVNDRYGIPTKAFMVTLKGLPQSGTEVFNRRTYGPYYDEMSSRPDSRTFDDRYEELQRLYDASSRVHSGSIRWHQAVVGEGDLIFPPRNQLAYWQEQSEGTEVILRPGMPHYPFGDAEFLLTLPHTNFALAI